MRLGVLDVGSNTVHLLVVDAHPGARPLPAYSHKHGLRLAELLGPDGAIAEDGVARLSACVAEAVQVAEDKGVQTLVPFATSAVREAPNVDGVLARIREETGVTLRVLSGPDEARLTFLAVRRWFGWSSGRLLVLDIGGGSLEIAAGLDEQPDVAVSLPLGAGRLTRTRLRHDPPEQCAVRELRRDVRAEIAGVVAEFSRLGRPDHVVATSRTFRQLARLTAPRGDGAGRGDARPRRVLRRAALSEWLPRLCAMSTAERAALPGVSDDRAAQLVAGAVVADAALDLFRVAEADICPWALREGVILRRLDRLTRPDEPGQHGALG